jgi:hypothetical protein
MKGATTLGIMTFSVTIQMTLIEEHILDTNARKQS